MLYEQQKYNLLREENEGYSKVIVELSESDNFANWEIDHISKNILSLISFFDLDPNRTVDVILGVYAEHPEKLGYVSLLTNFSKQSILFFLGIRLNQYEEQMLKAQKTNLAAKTLRTKNVLDLNEKQKKNIDPLPDLNLIQITASLLKFKLVTLEEVWPYLSPNDQSIKQAFVDKVALC